MADSIDAMKAELKATGYKEDANLHWHWRGGNFGAYSATFPSIDSAYRHYEEGKRMAELEAQNTAMKALLSSAALQLIELCLEDQERGNESSALRIHVKGVAAQMVGKLNELSE